MGKEKMKTKWQEQWLIDAREKELGFRSAEIKDMMNGRSVTMLRQLLRASLDLSEELMAKNESSSFSSENARIRWAWDMPNKNTFSVPVIKEFVKHYLRDSKVSIDPFARNKRWATHTNDINPETAAEYHMEAVDFLEMLREQGVMADLIIFDPPYSLEQAKRSYESVGKWKFEHTQNVGRWGKEKEICYDLLGPGGVFLHFGWHTNGMGKKYSFRKIELLVVAHGGAHHDTLCLAEVKEAHQRRLL